MKKFIENNIGIINKANAILLFIFIIISVFTHNQSLLLPIILLTLFAQINLEVAMRINEKNIAKKIDEVYLEKYIQFAKKIRYGQDTFILSKIIELKRPKKQKIKRYSFEVVHLENEIIVIQQIPEINLKIEFLYKK